MRGVPRAQEILLLLFYFIFLLYNFIKQFDLCKSTQEEFLDLPITVQGSSDLHTSLVNSFVMREHLTGHNQYRCEKCNNEYRDADKYCQLRTLPPILTFSLLRFTYDLKTFQRIKEVGKFEFPLELDLVDYMEAR
jgi:ubiquitin carboxyl-terminal hydrolase 40